LSRLQCDEASIAFHLSFLLIGEERRILVDRETALELQIEILERRFEDDVLQRAVGLGIYDDIMLSST